MLLFSRAGNHQDISWDDIEAFNQIWKWFRTGRIQPRKIYQHSSFISGIGEKKEYKYVYVYMYVCGKQKIKPWDA